MEEAGGFLNGSGVSCTLFDLLSLKNLDTTDYAALGVPSAPTTKAAHNDVALKALQQNRCQAQPADAILRGHLYLGSAQLARNLDFLKALGVTDIISLATFKATAACTSVMNSNINIWKVDIPDCLGMPVVAQFRASLNFITSTIFPLDSLPVINLQHIGRSHISAEATAISGSLSGHTQNHENKTEEETAKPHVKSNRVLFIHCQQGISRSTALVLLYLYYRLFLSLDENAKIEDIIDPRQILEKIQQFRAVAPNPSFLCQLQLIHEALQCAWSNGYGSDISSINKRRKAQFDLALKFCESYIETNERCIAETFAFITNCVLKNIIDSAKTSLNLGLRAWTLKNSIIRNYQIWFREALILEGFSTYAQQLASHHCIVRGIIKSESPDEEQAAFEAACNRVDQRWQGKEVEFLKLPLGDLADRANDKAIEDIPIIPAAFSPVMRNDRDAAVFPTFRLPLVPVFSEANPKTRQVIIRAAMGLKERNELDEKADISIDEQKRQLPYASGRLLMTEMGVAAEEVSSLMNQLLGRYGCKNWALWMMDRLACQCNRLAPRINKWIAMSEPSGVNVQSGVTLESEERSLKDGRKSKMRSAVDDAVESMATKKRRHVRYEDLPLEELRKEVASTREKVEEMRRVVSQLKRRSSFF